MSSKLLKYRTKLDTIIAFIDENEDELESDILIENKTITLAQKLQISLELKWYRVYASIASLVEVVESETEHAYEDSYYDVLVNSKRAVTTQETKVVAGMDNDYRNIKEIYTEAKGIMKEIQGVLDLLKTRNFVLSKQADLIIKGMDGHII